MKQNKRILALLLALGMALLTACGGAASSAPGASQAPSQQASSVAGSSVAASGEAPAGESAAPAGEAGTMRIGGLKGPTSMGMVKLMADSAAGETASGISYDITMFGAADEIVPKLVSGELDAAAIPANLASVLYNNTDGAVQVAAINTLGVLYVLETGDAIQSFEDLRGKTLYSTGKGTTPEFALNYLLAQNGLDPAADVTVEYKSEATEVAAMLAGAQDTVAVLPQPYVTAVQAQNDKVRTALSFSDEWERVGDGSSLVTGVLVVRREYLEANADVMPAVLDEYEAGINWVNSNVEDAAQLVEDYGIMEKAALAAKAIPACNIVYISNMDGGAALQEQLGGYLQVLYSQLPESVGGALPGDDFYYSAAGAAPDEAPEASEAESAA